MIPSRSLVFDMIRQKDMPYHIFCHSMMVRRAAVIIAHMLMKAGKNPDIKLIDRAALLHDICKIDSITAGGDHALMGRQLMEESGYPELGEIIGQHVVLKSLCLNEAMVVNYADKRVRDDHVVTLAQRFVDLMGRYGKDDGKKEMILSLYNQAIAEENIIRTTAGQDLLWLNNLNLIPGDYPLYGGYGFLRKD